MFSNENKSIVCDPESLKLWKEDKSWGFTKKLKNTDGKTGKRSKKCEMTLSEPAILMDNQFNQMYFRRATKLKFVTPNRKYDLLDKALKSDKTLLGFPKV